MEKKYQLFISATYKDLKEERDEAIKTVLKMGHFPIGMEMFNAEDEEQWQIIKRIIDSCDYYILILGFRYGSEDSDGISFTEKEYDYALRMGIPILSFLLKEDSVRNISQIDKNRTKIDKFREKVLSNTRMADFWHSKEKLSSIMVTALINQFDKKPRQGWVRDSSNNSLTKVSRDLKLDKFCGKWNSYGYNGLSNNIYQGIIEIHFSEFGGYKVITHPIDGDEYYRFTGTLKRKGIQYLLEIYNSNFDEIVIYSFMENDIPITRKGELIVLGVHIGFSHTNKSISGVGIFSEPNLNEKEIKKILGDNRNIQINEEFKEGYYDYYQFDIQKNRK